MAKIKVKGTEISIITVNNDDYISLTDMLKAKDGEFFISDWLRNRNTVEFLGVWERIYNPTFNYGEFAIIKSQAGLNSYKLSVKEWTEKTNAIGLKATACLPLQSGKSKCPFHPGKDAAGRAAPQVEPDRNPANETPRGRLTDQGT